LPHEFEAELVAGLRRCIEHACPVPMPKLPTIVVDIARRLGIDTTNFVAGEKWMRGFFARNPELAKRLPSKTNQVRLTHWNRIAAAEWYEAFGPLARSFTAMETFNMDDTSFDLETVKGKVRMGKTYQGARARAPLPAPNHPLLFRNRSWA